MINFENKTPFETSITIHGETRLLINNPLCTKDISSPPPKCKWFSEWIKILYFGPLYKTISFCIEPWSTFQLSITSDILASRWDSTTCVQIGKNMCLEYTVGSQKQ